MKDIIIQKLKDAIALLINQDADSFLVKNLPEKPSLKDYQDLLSKVQAGEIEI